MSDGTLIRLALSLLSWVLAHVVERRLDKAAWTVSGFIWMAAALIHEVAA